MHLHILQENEKLNLEIAKGNEQLKLAIENNKKYLASIDILVIKCENYTKDLIKAKNSEKNWKNQTKKSVNLLERALEERDIFHLLAAREHENCRHAINSASGLKLQHLKELSELFKNNVDSGKLMNFHSGKLKNMNQEVGFIKAGLEVNADSLSGKQHRENNQKLLKQIDEINLALKEESSLLADSGITVGLKDRKHLRDSLGASSSGSLDKSSEEDCIIVKSAVLTAL